MSTQTASVSKVKIALAWALALGIVLITALVFLVVIGGAQDRPETSDGPGPIVELSIGAFIIVATSVFYALFVLSDGFTYTFGSPVWKGLKARIYMLNIVIPVGLAVGTGVGLGGILRPILTGLGLSSGIAGLLPIIGAIAFFQLAQFWLLFWSPVERRVITKRLKAQGITQAQLEGAELVGISNPALSSFRKFGAIEDDIGALWLTPEQMVYYGDSERFAFTPDKVYDIERRGDTGSTTMLSGIAHIVLHVTMPTGEPRQIRLHMEGRWTMGQVRRAMDALAARLAEWHRGANAARPA